MKDETSSTRNGNRRKGRERYVDAEGRIETLQVSLRYSGKVELAAFTPKDVDIRDIAHGLARTNRWNGHTRVPVSVAWHAMLVSELCGQTSRAAALHGLLHDAAESYLGDWTRTAKGYARDELVTLSERIEDACLAAAGTADTAETAECVKAGDELALFYEKHAKWGMCRPLRDEADISLHGRIGETARRIACRDEDEPMLSPEEATEAFIRAAQRLMTPRAALQRSVQAWTAATREAERR